MKETIVVFGSKGQLGQEIQELAPLYENHYSFYYADLPEVDITNAHAVEQLCDEINPQIIINAAAYTQVDLAESEPEKAYAVNGFALKHLSQLCEKKNIFLLHISTDYVFDGHQNLPYEESDPTNPLSIYGKSKLLGEIYIHRYLSKAAIIRTSWLYSSYGNNFVKTIIRLTQEKPSLQVVYDQIGSPTYATDLAKACMSVVMQREKINKVELLHYANEGVASWYDFAKAILENISPAFPIEAIRTAQMPRPAPRPTYSVLSKEKFKQMFNVSIPNWKDSLILCLNKLGY